MTDEQVKNWLDRARAVNDELAALEESRTRISARAVSVTVSYSGERVSGTKDPHKLDNYLDSVERYSQLIERRIAALAAVSEEIFRVVCQVKDGRERAVLIHRYLNFQKWEQIAASLSYTQRHVARLHEKALLSVKGILEQVDKAALPLERRKEKTNGDIDTDCRKTSPCLYGD